MKNEERSPAQKAAAKAYKARRRRLWDVVDADFETVALWPDMAKSARDGRAIVGSTCPTKFHPGR